MPHDHAPSAFEPGRLHSPSGYGELTHSSRPSWKTWCFQTGTVALSRSIRAREAAYAWPRCGADAATSDRDVADLQVTGAVHGRKRDDLELRGHALGHLAQPVQRRRVGGVVEVVDLLAVVVVAHRSDEEVHSPGGGIVHRCEHLGRIERDLAEVEQPDHAPTASGVDA